MKSLKCPLCGNKTKKECRPFCSTRCAHIDLGNWLNEDYRVPVIEYNDLDDFEEGESG